MGFTTQPEGTDAWPVAKSGTRVSGPCDLFPYADGVECEDDVVRPDNDPEEMAVGPNDPNTDHFDELRIVLLGSVSDYVLHHATCTAILVR